MSNSAHRGAISLAVQSEHRFRREVLSGYLAGRAEFAVVGQTSTVEGSHALCRLRRPDFLLVDAGRVNRRTVDLLRGLHAAFPQTHVVVLYTELHARLLEDAVRSGLTALVPHSHGLEAVVRLIGQRPPARRAQRDGTALTERELAIVSLLDHGHRVPEIAALLDISPYTVENHKRRIYAKLGVGNQTQAVCRATSLGLVPGRAPDWHPAVRGGPAPSIGGADPPVLTIREHEILHSIASGHTVRQTARALGIADKTVQNTQARLFRKLGARNRSETLTIAYRLGMVDPVPNG
jgi:DNA-binding NarL/FixJ family response regulator